MIDAPVPDLLRLLALPVFAAAAWRDLRTRRVPNKFWYPLAVLGVVLLLWEYSTAPTPFRRTLLVRTTLLSVGIVVPMAYGFWRLGAFGGADAKALMTLAVLFPGYPSLFVAGQQLPFIVTTVGVFSLTILTNAVLLGATAPIGLALWNALDGRFDRRMLVARPVSWQLAERLPGTLLSAPREGTNGLDLDSLRMYLRWRGLTLEHLRSQPDLRDPTTLSDEPLDPTDGAVDPDERTSLWTSPDPTTEAAVKGHSPRQSGQANTDHSRDLDDPWGAETFLSQIEHDAYGTTPAELRDGLDVLVTHDEVWVSPGLPFLLAVFAGLLSALVLGDVLIGLFEIIGIV